MAIKLDFTDLRIIEELAQNARTDLKSLGEKLGVSDRTIARRIKMMEEAGILKKYTAVVDYEALRKATNLSTLSPKDTKEIEPIAIRIPELRGMMMALKRTFGTGMGLIIQYIGLGIGQGLVSSLPEEMEPNARCILGLQRLNTEGWGTFTIKLEDTNKFSCVVLMESNFLKVMEDNEEQLAFHILVKGIMTGFLEELFGTVYLNETMCSMQGEKRCEFKVNSR